MHALCIGCHARRAKEEGKPDLARCTDCHKERRNLIDTRDLASLEGEPIGRGMLLPLISK
jgi:cytochrome c553